MASLSAEQEGVSFRELSVVLLAPTGRDAPLICDLLQGEGISCRSVASVDGVIRAAGGSYATGLLLLAEEAVSSEKAQKLTQYLDEEPAWSDLPVLLLGMRERPCAHMEEFLNRRSTHFLRRPLKPATLLAAVYSALEIRRRQYEVRGLLENAAELNRNLKDRAQQLRTLSLQLSEVEERERNRMALYVHDNLQQVLAGAKFHVDVAEKRIENRPKLKESIRTIRQLVVQAIEETRALSHDLSPTVLRRHGLTAALQWLADHVEKLQGIAVRVRSNVTKDPDDATVVTFLFRSAQELLLNVSKHAGPTDVDVELWSRNELLFLQIVDKGRGFDLESWEQNRITETLGLFTVRERAELLGGRLNIESEPGFGTTVTLSVPAPKSSDGPETELLPGSTFSGTPAEKTVRKQEPGHVRLLLVDDHVVMRSGLRLILAEQPEIEVLGEYGDGGEAIDAADAMNPDVILMDVAMPKVDGVEATRIIKQRHPAIRVIGLSMFEDTETREKMIAAGAERYLSKAGPSEELLSAVFAQE